jgi:ACS family sodium-dependent inorganic phosphate cotransporter-like MFS transporter 5
MSVAVVKIADELDWSEGDKGFMLSAFFWGYALGQLPSSYLASVIGAKWMFAISILTSSLLSIATPAAILSKYGLTAGLAVRALLGLGASGTFPSAFYFYPEWIPLAEKTTLITTLGSGMYLGEIIGFSVSGFLCENRIDGVIQDHNIGSWPSVFILFGCLGLMWFPCFVYFVHRYGTYIHIYTLYTCRIGLNRFGREFVLLLSFHFHKYLCIAHASASVDAVLIL